MAKMLRPLTSWKPVNSKSIPEAMRQTGLDWSTSKRMVHFKKRDDTMRTYDRKFVVARDDNDEPLSVTGRNYRPLQNAEAFSIFQSFIDDGTLTLERGDCIGNGVSTFLIGTLSGSWYIGTQELEIKVAMSNDYSGRRSVRLSVIPVVDGTYMPLNVNGMKKRWAIWHTSSMHKNLERAQNAINDAYHYASGLCTLGDQLCQEDIDRSDATDFFNQLLAAPANEGNRGRTIREGRIMDLLAAWDQLRENKETRWGLLQAVSAVEIQKADQRPGEDPTSNGFLRRRDSLLKKMLNGNIPLFTKAEYMLT